MSIVNQKGLNVIEVQNQYLPDEGPKAIPLVLDFSLADDYDLDLQSLMNAGNISMVQSVFIDMKDSTVGLDLTVPATGQVIRVKPHTQGYYSVLCPNPVKLQFHCPGGPLMTLFLVNAAMPGVVWDSQ